MLMRLGVNAVAAAMIVPLWVAAVSCVSGSTPSVPPESWMLAIVMFGLWSLGDFVVRLKEKCDD